MERRRHNEIIISGDQDIEAGPRLEKNLLGLENEKGYVTQEEVSQYVDDIVCMLEGKKMNQQATVLMEVLSFESIRDTLMQTKEGQVQIDELVKDHSTDILRDVIARIRKQIFEELKSKLDVEEVFLLGKIILDNPHQNRIYELDGEPWQRRVVRDIRHAQTNERREAIELVQAGGPIEGLVHLYAYDQEEQALIVSRENFDTLADQVYSSDDIIPAHDAMQVILDCLEVVRELEHRGVVLEDINPDNIGIDKKTGKGVLFDVDGLFPLGKPSEHRLAKYGYLAPGVSATGPALPSETVYLFGKVMLEALAHLAKNDLLDIDKATKDQVAQLIADMIENKPDDRPSLSEACERLASIIPPDEDFIAAA